jgi:hypothetical protein
MEPSLQALLAKYTRFPDFAWVCGGFGALAEFTFEAGEPVVFAGSGTVGVPFRQFARCASRQ